MAESIIGKNLDNITNVAKGIDKEFLDMTYPDKYYRDVINPAKLGKAPIPSKMEMIGQSIKSFGPFKAMSIGLQRGKYGERAMPTKPAQKFLDTLKSAAKFGIKRAAPAFSIFGSTPLGADDEVTDDMRKSLEVTPVNASVRNNMGIMNPELTRKFDKSPAPLGRLDMIKQGVGSVFDKVRSVSPTGIIGSLLSNLDRFDDLSFADQDFITSQGLGQDKYGYNKRSAFGNYANLVKERAKIAADRRLKGLGQRAIDEYYEKLEKERQARLQRQIQQSIDRESGPGSYQSQAAAHESKVGRDSGERMGRV